MPGLGQRQAALAPRLRQAPPPRALRWAAGFGLGALAAGQPAPAPVHETPAELAAPQAAVRPANPPAAPAERPISPELAAALASALPKYDPAEARPQAADAAGAAPSPAPLPPANGILRLPDYVVHEAKIREFSERELYTPAGLEDLAVKRYITPLDHVLNPFSIPLLSGYSTDPSRGNSPEKRAMRKFEAQEAKDRAEELRGLMELEQLH